MRKVEDAREEIQSELEKLEFQPLFAREHLRLEDSLVSARVRAEESSEKIVMLTQRRKQLNEQVEARSEQLAQSVGLLQEDAQIVSSFSGQVLRTERRPDNKTVVHSVFYREKLMTGKHRV